MSEEAIHLLLRATARTSGSLFPLAFTAAMGTLVVRLVAHRRSPRSISAGAGPGSENRHRTFQPVLELIHLK